MLPVPLYGAETWTLKACEAADHFPESLREDHPWCHKVPAVGTEADIQDPGKQVWHGLDHSRHHHG